MICVKEYGEIKAGLPNPRNKVEPNPEATFKTGGFVIVKPKQKIMARFRIVGAVTILVEHVIDAQNERQAKRIAKEVILNSVTGSKTKVVEVRKI